MTDPNLDPADTVAELMEVILRLKAGTGHLLEALRLTFPAILKDHDLALRVMAKICQGAAAINPEGDVPRPRNDKESRDTDRP